MGRKQRVALVVGSLHPGGAERQLIELVNHLDRARYEPILITWAGAGRLAGEVAADVRRFDLDLVTDTHAPLVIRARTGARLYRALVRVFRETRPDLVHGYLFQSYAVGALAARRSGVPVMVSGRRNLATYHELPWPARILGRAANAITDLHIANSDAARRAALELERLPPARVAVVHNGVAPPDSGVALPPEARDWFQPGVPAAAVLAGLKPVKAHARLLELLATLPEELPLRVVCFGAGPLRAQLEQRIGALGLEHRVVLAGAHPEARHWLPHFDFLIHPSLRESSPNAVLEAMAAGIPVVAFRVGGIPELVEHRSTGLLGDSVEEVATHIALLASDEALRARLGAAAQLRSDRFSVDAMVEATEAHYGRLLGLARAARPNKAARTPAVDDQRSA